MTSKSILYYGEEREPPERIHLQAGPLSLIFEPGGTFLRYIRLGEQEILRGIYTAVRDLNWNTVMPQVSNLQLDKHDDSFQLNFDVLCQDADLNLNFAWNGKITGDCDGTVIYKLDGIARSTFLRNRIGFCVLHSTESAGSPARIEHVDGFTDEAVLPRHIAPQLFIDGLIKPHRPFEEMRTLTHRVQEGLWAKVHFSGDIFELEDQRNWTDASYKTYCTPLRLPFPAEVEEGAVVSQAIRLTLEGDVPEPAIGVESDPVTFSIGNDAARSLPRIGLGVASHGQTLGDGEIERLRALRPAHLRVDLKLQNDAYRQQLQRAAEEARQLDTLLEVALHLSDNAEVELQQFRSTLIDVEPSVKSWLIYHSEHSTTPEGTLANARRHLRDYNTQATFGAGTNVYFTDLNRDRLPAGMLEEMDFVCYSLNPQVHAFDNASLTETLAMQGVTVRSAKHYLNDVPVAVTPITLQPRFNPNATGDEPDRAPDTLPAEVDPRQMSLFGAGWTAGSIKYISESGADSVTYFETSGWRGVMETPAGSPLPDKFQSLPGCVFPLYHVLADVNEFTGGEILPGHSTNPLKADGLAIRLGDNIRFVLANMTAESQQVVLKDVKTTVHARRLNENNVVQAMCSPLIFRSQEDESLTPTEGSLSFSMLPYEVIRIDV